MNEYRSGKKVDFQSTIYVIISDEGNSLVVKRPGSNSPISIPKSQAKLLLEEGRSDYDTKQSLNG